MKPLSFNFPQEAPRPGQRLEATFLNRLELYALANNLRIRHKYDREKFCPRRRNSESRADGRRTQPSFEGPLSMSIRTTLRTANAPASCLAQRASSFSIEATPQCSEEARISESRLRAGREGNRGATDDESDENCWDFHNAIPLRKRTSEFAKRHPASALQNPRKSTEDLSDVKDMSSHSSIPGGSPG
jgi:hypothetical protein